MLLLLKKAALVVFFKFLPSAGKNTGNIHGLEKKQAARPTPLYSFPEWHRGYVRDFLAENVLKTPLHI